jgi:hypothetical protein
MFRASDDAAIFPFVVPSNFFAAASLKDAAEMLGEIYADHDSAAKCLDLAREVEAALHKRAVVAHPQFGSIYAYEVDGFGGAYCFDDPNVPSLLSLPYLGIVDPNDPLYRRTRDFVLSKANPYYFSGSAAEGPGSPHTGKDRIWPLGIIMRALTSTDDQEIRMCLLTLQRTHADTGFMHESFNKDDASRFTRSWFAWANGLFGELILKIFAQRPYLLD